MDLLSPWYYFEYEKTETTDHNLLPNLVYNRHLLHRRRGPSCNSNYHEDGFGGSIHKNRFASFWELRVESDIRDSIGFTVYGEAANLNSQQILNGITLSIKGVHEVDGVERNVNESKRLEPLFDTLKLYHSIFYKP
jgi:hypothetical protein